MKLAAKGALWSVFGIMLVVGIAACGAILEKGVGNYVWIDSNGDGVQDGAELGAPEVTVKVFTESGTSVAEIQTNNQGYYSFEDLESGRYYLEFIPKDEYVLTIQDATGDELDSDPDPFSRRTEVFEYTKGEDDIRWDAGVVDRSEVDQPTATPTATTTATPTPTTTPNAASAFIENEDLAGADLVTFPEFADIGSINTSGQFTGNTLDKGDSLLDLMPFFVRDMYGRLYFGVIGLTDGLSVNLSMYSPGDPQFRPGQQRNFDTGTADSPKRPSFEQGDETYAGDPGMCLSPNAFLADVGRILADLHPEEVHSIWVYREREDGSGFDLVHVRLTEEQIGNLLDWIESGPPPTTAERERVFAFGRVSTLSGEEIVEVTTEEVVFGLHSYFVLNPTSDLTLELIDFYDCVAELFARDLEQDDDD
jgi:hypothetical protein